MASIRDRWEGIFYVFYQNPTPQGVGKVESAMNGFLTKSEKTSILKKNSHKLRGVVIKKKDLALGYVEVSTNGITSKIRVLDSEYYPKFVIQ